MQKKSFNDLLKAKKNSNILDGIYWIFRWLLILSVGYIILFPLFKMISTSFKTQAQLLNPSVIWIPTEFKFDNFKYAWEVVEYGKAFFATLRINVLSALVQVLTCSLTAYGFARFKVKFKGLWTAILMLTIIVPPQMIGISTYISFRNFDILGILGFIEKIFNVQLKPNLINTAWSFVLPSIFSVGLKSGLITYIYIQFFKGLPKELEEAAYIDGANAFKTFLAIVWPSSGVAILTVSIFSIVWYWNECYLSVLYFSKNITLAPILSGLQDYLINNGITNENASMAGIVMAACLLFVLPILIMYLILQKQFIQSISRVGIVG